MFAKHIFESFKKKTATWRPELPVLEEEIRQLLEDSGLDLPEDYLDFLRHSNGGEGDLPVLPFNAVIWPAREIMENNRGYELRDFVPGFFAFGGNGGGEMLAFDTRTPPPWKIYTIPYISSGESDAELVANSFEEFVGMLGHPHEPDVMIDSTQL